MAGMLRQKNPFFSTCTQSDVAPALPDSHVASAMDMSKSLCRRDGQFLPIRCTRSASLLRRRHFHAFFLEVTQRAGVEWQRRSDYGIFEADFRRRFVHRDEIGRVLESELG